jgi:hypothetical protein
MLLAIDGASPATLDEIRRRLVETPAHVEGVTSSEVYDTLTALNADWTLVCETEFEDEAAVQRYRDHPYHLGPIRQSFEGLSLRVSSAFFRADEAAATSGAEAEAAGAGG